MLNRIKLHLSTSLFLNSYLLILMRMFSTGFGFLFWVFAARMMDARDVGLASGTISAVTLLAGLGQFGLGYGLVRYLPQSKKPNKLLSFLLIISGLAGILWSLIFIVGLPTWSPHLLFLRSDHLYTLLFILLVGSWTLSILLHWVFIATRRAVYSLTRQSSHMIIAVIVLLVLTPLVSDISNILIAHTLATVVSVALSLHVLPKVQPGYSFSFIPRGAFEGIRQSLFTRYSVTNYGAEQFQRIPNSLFPLLVLNRFGPSESAYFFVAWTIGAALPSWIAAMGHSLFAEGSKSPARASQYARRSALLGFILIGGLVLILTVSGRLILSIYGPDYVEYGLVLLYFLIWTAVPKVLLSIFISFLRVRDCMKAVFTITVFSNTLGLLLAYFVMTELGIVGAGIGWLSGQLLVLAGTAGWWRWQQAQRKQGTSIPTPVINQVP